MTCYALDGRPGSSSGFPGGERVDRGASVHPPVTRTMLRDVGNQTLSGWSALQRRFTTLSWTVGAGSPGSPGSPRIVPGRGSRARLLGPAVRGGAPRTAEFAPRDRPRRSGCRRRWRRRRSRHGRVRGVLGPHHDVETVGLQPAESVPRSSQVIAGHLPRLRLPARISCAPFGDGARSNGEGGPDTP